MYGKKRNFGRVKKRYYKRKTVKRAPRFVSGAGRINNRKTSSVIKAVRPKWEKAIATQDTKLLKFVYMDDSFDMSTVIGENYQSLQVFAGNSLFDPDYTGVGVQPYGFDNWCSSTAFFSKYEVFASAITVYLSTSANFTVCPKVMVYVIPTEKATFAYHDLSDLVQIQHAKVKSFGLGNYKNGSQMVVKHYITSNQVLGKSRGSDGSCVAAYNASPTNLWLWHVYVDTSQWANESTILMDVKIKYYAKLLAPNSQNES